MGLDTPPQIIPKLVDEREFKIGHQIIGWWGNSPLNNLIPGPVSSSSLLASARFTAIAFGALVKWDGLTIVDKRILRGYKF